MTIRVFDMSPAPLRTRWRVICTADRLLRDAGIGWVRRLSAHLYVLVWRRPK